MIFTLFGILSGVLIILGDIPYAVNTYNRKTHPHKVTWFIIVILNIIGFANQKASGATNSLIFMGCAVFITLVILIITHYKGVGGHNKLDVAVLAGAGLGLLMWWLLDTPLASIIANVVVGTLALTPTYIKAYHRPYSETKITWLVGTVSTLLASISVGKLDLELLIIPITASIQQAGLFTLIEIRERQLKKTTGNVAMDKLKI
jgi:hypothetical protein